VAIQVLSTNGCQALTVWEPYPISTYRFFGHSLTMFIHHYPALLRIALRFYESLELILFLLASCANFVRQEISSANGHPVSLITLCPFLVGILDRLQLRTELVSTLMQDLVREVKSSKKATREVPVATDNDKESSGESSDEEQQREQ